MPIQPYEFDPWRQTASNISAMLADAPMRRAQAAQMADQRALTQANVGLANARTALVDQQTARWVAKGQALEAFNAKFPQAFQAIHSGKFDDPSVGEMVAASATMTDSKPPEVWGALVQVLSQKAVANGDLRTAAGALNANKAFDTESRTQSADLAALERGNATRDAASTAAKSREEVARIGLERGITAAPGSYVIPGQVARDSREIIKVPSAAMAKADAESNVEREVIKYPATPAQEAVPGVNPAWYQFWKRATPGLPAVPGTEERTITRTRRLTDGTNATPAASIPVQALPTTAPVAPPAVAGVPQSPRPVWSDLVQRDRATATQAPAMPQPPATPVVSAKPMQGGLSAADIEEMRAAAQAAIARGKSAAAVAARFKEYTGQDL